MLRMTQANYIKDLYENEDLSLREICRKTGHSFRTVKKYAQRSDWSREQTRSTAPKDHPVLGDFIEQIDIWLEEDRKIPRKQRHTKKRIYTRLRNEFGFTGSYSSVKRYVRKKKQQMQAQYAGHVPLEHAAGNAQVDFGELQYIDAEQNIRKAYELILSFEHSDKAFVQVFPSQNQECLLEGMQRIFQKVGGTPARIRFDNMATAVAQIREGRERVLADGFERFKLHYRFQADFCNPASGNEKGNVENKVGYIRRNFFVPMPVISNFNAYNEQLWQRCEEDGERLHYKTGRTINDMWQEDKAKLLSLPEHLFSAFRLESVTVDKCGFVRIDTNKYGLPPALEKEIVQAQIYYDHIEFFHDHKPVARYVRSYERNKEFCDWTKYIGVLLKRPNALEDAVFFRKMPQQWQIYLSDTHGKDRRDALQLLQDIVQDGNAADCDALLTLATETGKRDVDTIRQCYYSLSKERKRPAPLHLEQRIPCFSYSPNLSAYDRLTGGATHG